MTKEVVDKIKELFLESIEDSQELKDLVTQCRLMQKEFPEHTVEWKIESLLETMILMMGMIKDLKSSVELFSIEMNEFRRLFLKK